MQPSTTLYNPAATLHLMEQYTPRTSRTFFDKWFAATNSDNKLPRVHHKRFTIVALCALTEVEPNAIPEAVRKGWPGIVAGALKVLKDLPKAIAGMSFFCMSLLLEPVELRDTIGVEGFGDGDDGERGISAHPQCCGRF